MNCSRCGKEYSGTLCVPCNVARTIYEMGETRNDNIRTFPSEWGGSCPMPIVVIDNAEYAFFEIGGEFGCHGVEVFRVHPFEDRLMDDYQNEPWAIWYLS